MAKIDELFRTMVEKKASDLHLSSAAPPFLRLHGEMVVLEGHPVMTNEEIQVLVFEILSEKQKRNFVENWELDCAYTVEGLARFRVNVFMQRRGMACVFRVIPDKIKTVEELNLPPEFLNLIDVHRGLICVTGPTGSGKSTTLAALINHINANEQSHIITIEDPIEFVHQNQKSLVNQREVTSHTKSFANALKATLREDPDIILVGEMRDIETIQLALTAAETGHLVFGTLHTSSAHKTIDRIIDVFPEDRQEQVRVMLAESLRGVIAQTLLPKADGQGRVAAFECLFNTKAIANLIREGKTFQIPSTMQITRGTGNITFESSIAGLVTKNLITRQQANEVLGLVTEEKKAEAEAASSSHGTGTPMGAQPHIPNMPPLSPKATGVGGAVGGALSNLTDRLKKAR